MAGRTEAYLNACLNGTGVDGLPTPLSDLDRKLYTLAYVLSKGVSWDELLDKPFEETIDGMDIWLEQDNVESGMFQNANPEFGTAFGGFISISNGYLGETLIVTVDGVDYTGVFREDEGDIFLRFSGDFEEAPCRVYVDDENDDYLCIEFYDEEKHSVKLTHVRKSLTTLDQKYLPKAEAVADVTEAPTAENFNALLTALRNAGYMNT